jgi:8-oxo-dGTP pyrophosphatase MutT (NUDIX family)
MSVLPGFDPQSAPVAVRQAEPVLHPDIYAPAQLMRWFDQGREQPGFPDWAPELVHDRRRPSGQSAHAEPIAASVLITILESASPTMVLTRRTAHLEHHAGQISFPGGRAESADRDPEATALREAQEEIGIDPAGIRILGRLPEYFTVTGYRVTPIVALADAQASFQPDPHEVAEIFQVPMAFLMDPKNHQLRILSAHVSPTREEVSFYAMPYRSPDPLGQECFIWGATAAMIRNFYHFLAAVDRQSNSLNNTQLSAAES